MLSLCKIISEFKSIYLFFHKNGYLTVTAKREHKVDDSKENYVRRERSYGSFSRSFYVGDVRKEDVEASLENGELKIVLPKGQKRVNRIEIKYAKIDKN